MDKGIKYHRLCNGFFQKYVIQFSQYLLGNGVTLPDKIKNKLGIKFDRVMSEIGMNAMIHSVAWAFWNVDHLVGFSALEFVALMDEENSNIRMGIRFLQMEEKRPLYIEIFKENGYSKYKVTQKDDGKQDIEVLKSLAPYKQKIQKDIVSERVIEEENYTTIPIIPVYANLFKTSEFTNTLKSFIDAHDFISSNLVDDSDIMEGVYRIIQNYGGTDAAQLISELNQLKATYSDTGQEAMIKNDVVEIPFQGKMKILEFLEKQMFSVTMALDIKALTGGSLTNVAINVSKTEMDLKADIFEWYMSDCIINILALIGVYDEEPQFKRRTITNDEETVKVLSAALSDGYIDLEFCIDHSPIIPDDEQEELKKRILNKLQEQVNNSFPLNNEEEAEEENIYG